MPASNGDANSPAASRDGDRASGPRPVALGDRGEPARVDVEREHPLDLAARRPRSAAPNVSIDTVRRRRLDARTAATPVRQARPRCGVTGVGHDRVARRPEPGEEPPGLLERERPARLDDVPRHRDRAGGSAERGPAVVQRPPTGAEPEP